MKLNIGTIFLRHVSKHFVAMSYRALAPGIQERELHLASCFVVALECVWFLVTAGHVVDLIEGQRVAGVQISEVMLHDRLAGNKFEHAVQFYFARDEWIVFHADENGMDYAVTPLPPLIVRGLIAGNVIPIGEETWGALPFSQYPDWLLVGIPAETRKQIGEKTLLNFTLIPLRETVYPGAGEAPANKVYAEIITKPDKDSAAVKDVAGMSGGPIFGVVKDDTKQSAKYWLIGVQSTYFMRKRIVGFCPLPEFLVGLKEAVRIIRERAAASKSGVDT